MTSPLKEKILPEYTEVIRDKKEVKITWLEKIEDLLARKRRTNYKTNPKLSFAIIISIILLT